MEIQTTFPHNKTRFDSVRKAPVGTVLLLRTSNGLCPAIRVQVVAKFPKLADTGVSVMVDTTFAAVIYLADEGIDIGYKCGDLRWDNQTMDPLDLLFDEQAVQLGKASIVLDYSAQTIAGTISASSGMVFTSDDGLVILVSDRGSSGKPIVRYVRLSDWLCLRNAVTGDVRFDKAHVVVPFGDDFPPFCIPLCGAADPSEAGLTSGEPAQARASTWSR